MEARWARLLQISKLCISKAKKSIDMKLCMNTNITDLYNRLKEQLCRINSLDFRNLMMLHVHKERPLWYFKIILKNNKHIVYMQFL
jgi:hypothetical protein